MNALTSDQRLQQMHNSLIIDFYDRTKVSSETFMNTRKSDQRMLRTHEIVIIDCYPGSGPRPNTDIGQTDFGCDRGAQTE